MSDDKKHWVTTDDDEDGGSLPPLEDSYGAILRRLGVDTRDMSLDDIRNIIHQYAQEGVLKGAKVIDIKTKKAKQTYSNGKKERFYQVKADDGVPVSEAELDNLRKDQEYKARTEKRNEEEPKPPFNPTPKAPL